jgi:hypothetical protein
MSSALASSAAASATAAAAADVFGLASFAVVGARGEEEVEEKVEDEFDDAIGKSILPGRF